MELFIFIEMESLELQRKENVTNPPIDSSDEESNEEMYEEACVGPHGEDLVIEKSDNYNQSDPLKNIPVYYFEYENPKNKYFYENEYLYLATGFIIGFIGVTFLCRRYCTNNR